MNLLKREHSSTRNARSTRCLAGRHTTFEGVSIVPGHPLCRASEQLSAMFLQPGQVVESVRAAELAGVDEAHEQVAHPRAVLGLVEQRVLPMKNSHLQRSFGDVIVQRGRAASHMMPRYPSL